MQLASPAVLTSPHGPGSIVGARFSLEQTTYRVTHRIARGGSSFILSARACDDASRAGRGRPRNVAVKISRPGPMREVADERLRRETALLLDQDHRNIVGALAPGVWRDDPCLILERIEGQTLARRLRGGPRLGLTDLLAVVRDVLLALAYLLHDDRFVAHRDIKPAYFMLDDTGSAKLIDFGSARTRFGFRPGLVTDLVGTLPYLAPETMSDPASADVRSDLYALGMVLFRMLSGRDDLLESSWEGLLEQQRAERFPPVGLFHGLHEHAALADACQLIVSRALRARPEERYQTPYEFLRDVREALDLARMAERADEQQGSTNRCRSPSALHTIPDEGPLARIG